MCYHNKRVRQKINPKKQGSIKMKKNLFLNMLIVLLITIITFAMWVSIDTTERFRQGSLSWFSSDQAAMIGIGSLLLVSLSIFFVLKRRGIHFR